MIFLFFYFALFLFPFPRVWRTLGYSQGGFFFLSLSFFVEICVVLLAGSTGSDEREISIYFSHLYII